MTEKKPGKSPMRYLGLGIQLAAMVGIMAYLGFNLTVGWQLKSPGSLWPFLC